MLYDHTIFILIQAILNKIKDFQNNQFHESVMLLNINYSM